MQATELRASDRYDGGRELVKTAHNCYAVFEDECQYSCFGGGCLDSRSGTVGGEAYVYICRQHPAGTVISRSGERHVLVIGMDEDQTSGTRREAAIHSTYLRRRRHRYGGGGGVAQAGRPDLDLHCLY